MFRGELKVKVPRGDLLAALQKNRDGHRTQFERALDEYRTAVIRELEDWLERARKGERVDRRTRLVQPQDHTDDYNRAIRMVEMASDEVIEMDETLFQRFVLDEWEWKGQFTETLASNAAYLQGER